MDLTCPQGKGDLERKEKDEQAACARPRREGTKENRATVTFPVANREQNPEIRE